MQWTARNIIMVVTLILTATLAPIGWLIQKYWIHGNGEQNKWNIFGYSKHTLIQIIRILLEQTSTKASIGRNRAGT